MTDTPRQHCADITSDRLVVDNVPYSVVSSGHGIMVGKSAD